MLKGQWGHHHYGCHGIGSQDHRSQASLSLIGFKILGRLGCFVCLTSRRSIPVARLAERCRPPVMFCNFTNQQLFLAFAPSRQRLETPLWPTLGVKLLQINTLWQWPSSLADKESVTVAGSHKLAWYHGHIYVAWILFPEGTFCHAHVET